MTTASPPDLSGIVLDILARAPDWLRRDLASDDRKLRSQAEETLATMLTAALANASK